jgi:hypothetical protein
VAARYGSADGSPKAESYPSFSSTIRNTWRIGGRPSDRDVVEVDRDVVEVGGDVGRSVVAVDDEPDEQAAANRARPATSAAAVTFGR